MHKVRLTYSLADPDASRSDGGDLHHPLMALLDALHRSGSISGAARLAGLSYRHVWGELKRWETQLGRPLVSWVKGQPAVLTPFGEKLLWAERRAQARLAPQIEAMRGELEQAFAVAFDDSAGVVTMSASHDDALPRLRERAQRERRLYLDIQFSGSVDALAALNDGRCLVAGFHVLTGTAAHSPTARAYRPLLDPGRHRLMGFAQRTQGLMLAPGNPQHVQGLHDLVRPGLRFANRPRGTGTRVVLEEMLQAQGVAAAGIDGFDRVEPSHRAVAEAVASGSADAAFGIEAAARAKGLDFLPLAQEHYFLAALATSFAHPHLEALLALLRTPAWQAELAAIPGYTPDRCGRALSLADELPQVVTPRNCETR